MAKDDPQRLAFLRKHHVEVSDDPETNRFNAIQLALEIGCEQVLAKRARREAEAASKHEQEAA